MAKIEIAQAKKVYSNSVTALHGIDLTVGDGEMLVLVGPSGCGKSTLLRMIAGLETISSGTISIDGQVVNDIEPARRDIAMVFQNYALYPHMTVRGNLEYGMKNRNIPAAERAKLVDEAARILELEPYLERKPTALSGGQRQRVAMGRAIVRKPRAFLFDEPLSNLDAKLRGHMRVEIKKLQRTLATTSVFVTHDQLEAMTLADRLVVMNQGRIEQIGTPIEVYNKPISTFVARFIGAPGMNIMPTESLGAAKMPDDFRDRPFIGFRPEAVRMGWNGDGMHLEGDLEGIEILGPEALVHLNVDGVEETIIARISSAEAEALSGRTRFEIPGNDLHSFDR